MYSKAWSKSLADIPVHQFSLDQGPRRVWERIRLQKHLGRLRSCIRIWRISEKLRPRLEQIKELRLQTTQVRVLGPEGSLDQKSKTHRMPREYGNAGSFSRSPSGSRGGTPGSHALIQIHAWKMY